MEQAFANFCKGYFDPIMLNDPLKIEFDKVDLVGFAMRRPRDRQFHVGLLYKHGKKTYLRHHCDHLDLKEEEASNMNDLWTDIAALSQLNKRLIANKMAKAGSDKVPYGIGYRVDGKYIDKKTMKYAVTEIGQGLTCSTYIVAALETLGFFPFKRSEWEATEQDTAWQKTALEDQVRRHPEAEEHFKAEQCNVGGPRFRPDHIVASAYPAEWPIAQDKANELGVQVIACYDSKRP
jgi:hypothetical protein